MCGHPPVQLMPGILPFFCSNDDCQMFSWDPNTTQAKLLAAPPGEIDLSHLDPSGGNIAGLTFELREDGHASRSDGEGSEQ